MPVEFFRIDMTKCWFIDLDDSIFEASGGMLHAIHLRMNEFIVKELRISWEAASNLRSLYWTKYGATFLGLWKHYGIDPCVFLKATHEFDLSPYVARSGMLSEDLRKLHGRRVVFTNGPRNYAEKVIELLGIERVIDDLVSSTDMHLFNDWRPKPSRSMLLSLCHYYGVRSSQAAMIDDSLMNLKVAHGLGVKTILCTGYRKRNGKMQCRRRPLYVDFSVGLLREVHRLPINVEKGHL